MPCGFPSRLRVAHLNSTIGPGQPATANTFFSQQLRRFETKAAGFYSSETPAVPRNKEEDKITGRVTRGCWWGPGRRASQLRSRRPAAAVSPSPKPADQKGVRRDKGFRSPPAGQHGPLQNCAPRSDTVFSVFSLPSLVSNRTRFLHHQVSGGHREECPASSCSVPVFSLPCSFQLAAVELGLRHPCF